MNKAVATKTKKPKLTVPVVGPVWLDVNERSFKAFKNDKGNESVMVTFSANDTTKGRYFEIVGIKTRRRPVPIPGRLSNAELQRVIDETNVVITKAGYPQRP
jgi:hypothetical protein